MTRRAESITMFRLVAISDVLRLANIRQQFYECCGGATCLCFCNVASIIIPRFLIGDFEAIEGRVVSIFTVFFFSFYGSLLRLPPFSHPPRLARLLLARTFPLLLSPPRRFLHPLGSPGNIIADFVATSGTLRTITPTLCMTFHSTGHFSTWNLVLSSVIPSL